MLVLPWVAPLSSLEPEPVWYRYGVVDLALDQGAKPLENNIEIRLGTLCSGLFPKMFFGDESATLTY